MTATNPGPAGTEASRTAAPRKRQRPPAVSKFCQSQLTLLRAGLAELWSVFGPLALKVSWTPGIRFGAFLSPGVSYVVGHGLQLVIYWKDNRLYRRKEQIDLIDNQINQLIKERDDARNNAMDGETVEIIQRQITVHYQQKMEIMSRSIGVKVSRPQPIVHVVPDRA